MTGPEIAKNPNSKVSFGWSFRRFWHTFRQIVILAGVAAGQFGMPQLAAQETPSVRWLTGPQFQKELLQPFPLSWTLTDLRQAVMDVGADRKISIVLDRRLDPSAQFPFDAKNVSFRAGLDELAKMAKGDVCVPGNFAFLGPESAIHRLRTLIELRKPELQSKETGISDRRRSELQRHRTFSWNDLNTPQEILDAVTNPFRLKITNADRVPHDLWAAAALPDASLTEALSVVLIQFDLTFRWADSGASIELIPIPEQISVERKHRSKLNPTDAIDLIHQRFPGLEAKTSNAEIFVNASVEEHEAISNLLRGDSRPPPSVKAKQPDPIRQRSYTLRLEQPVPLSALMKKLEESDIHFEYNADDLKAAGIDLEQSIQPDVKNLTAPEFFKLIFDPAGLDFQIERQTVKLKPKRLAPSKQ